MIKKPEYKRLSKDLTVFVHVIEVVTEMKNLAELEEMLENIQQYSAAEIVERFAVEGEFGANCTILTKRRIKE